MVKKDLFRKDIVKWAKKQPDLEIILKNCPIKYRKICILSGYLQFAKYADKTIFLNSWISIPYGAIKSLFDDIFSLRFFDFNSLWCD